MSARCRTGTVAARFVHPAPRRRASVGICSAPREVRRRICYVLVSLSRGPVPERQRPARDRTPTASGSPGCGSGYIRVRTGLLDAEPQSPLPLPARHWPCCRRPATCSDRCVPAVCLAAALLPSAAAAQSNVPCEEYSRSAIFVGTAGGEFVSICLLVLVGERDVLATRREPHRLEIEQAAATQRSLDDVGQEPNSFNQLEVRRISARWAPEECPLT